MKVMVAVLGLIFSSLGFAHHFTGSYQTQQGIAINIQHASNGQMQGNLTGAGIQFQLQGQGNQEGAQGVLSSQQGVLGFQAQISPDGQVLQMMIFPMNQQGQADQSNAQQLIAQRVAGMQQPGSGGTTNQPFPPNLPGSGGQTPFPPAPPAGSGAMVPGGQFPAQNPASTFPATPNPSGQFPQLPGSAPGAGPVVPGPQAPDVNTPFPQAPVAQAGWAGSYSDGQLTLTLQGTAGNYQGSLNVSGQQMTVQAAGDEVFLELQIQTAQGLIPAFLERYEGQVYLFTETQEFVLKPVNGMIPATGLPVAPGN